MALAALDIPQKQCLIDFFDDADGFCWHHRVLLYSSGNKDGRWIACSPDHDLEVLDLSRHRVLPLARAGPYPRDREAEGIYKFDPVPADALEDIFRRAKDLAEMVGFPLAAGTLVETGRWRLSDSAGTMFGALVPTEAFAAEDATVVRGEVGLVKIEGAWTAMELVRDDGVSAWRERKANGGGIDGRLLPLGRDAHGRRYRYEVEAAALWKNSKEEDFPLKGSKVVHEFFDSLRSAGHSLQQHHLDFVKRSGVADKGHIAREHWATTEALRLFATHDQFDLSMSAGADLMARRLVMMEMAVARNPRNPDWDGLDVVMSHRVSETGGAVVANFES